MIQFPHKIDGWLTELEGRALARLAIGKRVLEIGSYCGRSTVCLAQTAEHVVSIDPHDGRGTPDPRDTYEAFAANLKAYGVSKVVTAIRGTLDNQKLPGKFGLIFIDGAHDIKSVRRDTDRAIELLAADGLLAFHDYRTKPGEYDGRWDAGVTEAVNEILDGGSELVERIGSIAVVRPKGVRGSQVVALSMPRRDETVVHGAMLGALNCVSRPTRVLSLELPPSSLLNHGFNQHWAQAINARDTLGATHFAMLHSDVCPEPGWLTTLLDELTALDADIVSAVIPIKDERGLTSTAVYQGNPWERRRLTLAEVAELPETFSADDAGGSLMLNTGLWVCDLRKSWVDEWCFNSLERIVTKNCRRVAEVVPEDWNLSHWLNERGGKLFATSKVSLTHQGSTGFTNGKPWGAWSTDEDFQPLEQEAVA